MERINLAGEREITETTEQDKARENDIRTLQDLELVLAGGGDDPAGNW